VIIESIVTSFLEGALAGYGIAIPVGAVAILIVNTAIGCGFPTGFMAGAGAATADFAYALVASAAGAALAALLEPFSAPLRTVSGLVLIGLAAVGLAGVRRAMEAEEGQVGACSPLRMYARFVGITLINPLTVVYFTAFILGRGTAGLAQTPLAMAAFVLGAGLASLSWQTLLAALGGVVGRHLTPRFRGLATVAGNLLVLGLGAHVLLGVLS
jgi:threonine/homoserine/homoserine lactone efflux protein